MAKGKHQKKQQISLSFLAVLLLAVSFFSTASLQDGN
ncbi:hypothetical protein OK3_03391 [Enterococcus faecium EnGen0036]|nr:hypothetical protein OK3_03391 [Enterococcus faecium EnGen0036]